MRLALMDVIFMRARLARKENTMTYRGVTAFLSGTIFGSIITYVALKSKFEKKADEEIDSIRQYYISRDTKAKDAEKVEEKHESIVSKVANDISDKSPKEEEYKDYSKIAKKDYADIAPVENLDRPYVISEGDYLETNLHYSKEPMSYYPMDDVLVDIDDEPVMNVESLVGYGLKERFIPPDGEDYIDEIYIRNDNISRDFQITQREGRFFYDPDQV